MSSSKCGMCWYEACRRAVTFGTNVEKEYKKVVKDRKCTPETSNYAVRPVVSIPPEKIEKYL